jgi:hypothetical protein
LLIPEDVAHDWNELLSSNMRELIWNAKQQFSSVLVTLVTPDCNQMKYTIAMDFPPFQLHSAISSHDSVSSQFITFQGKNNGVDP